VTEVSCPHFAYALPAYYLIAPSEASSNLARFDSVRYGLRVGDDGERSLEEVMSLTRDAGFGPEVKRRIILGTYALSSGYYDAYYGQAQKVRTLITRDFTAAFEQADVLVSPASPGVAFPLGAKLDDPLAMYRQDLATIPSNLYGGPAMSLPVGLSEGLPVGLQVMAPTMRDDLLYQVGGALEARCSTAGAGRCWRPRRSWRCPVLSCCRSASSGSSPPRRRRSSRCSPTLGATARSTGPGPCATRSTALRGCSAGRPSPCACSWGRRTR
jgi:Asp-tRNA(Asn)/Glu-tRNA(Gln) amidotransferase A subunit family amidase